MQNRLPKIGEEVILIKSHGCNEGDEGFISKGTLVNFFEEFGFYNFVVQMNTELYWHIETTFFEIVEDLLFIHLTNGSYSRSEDIDIKNIKWHTLC